MADADGVNSKKQMVCFGWKRNKNSLKSIWMYTTSVRVIFYRKLGPYCRKIHCFCGQLNEWLILTWWMVINMDWSIDFDWYHLEPLMVPLYLLCRSNTFRYEYNFFIFISVFYLVYSIPFLSIIFQLKISQNKQ